MTRFKQSTSAGLLLALLSGLWSFSTRAEPLPPSGPIPFKSFDQDGNGRISEQEFDSVRGQRMASKAAQGRPMTHAAKPPPFAELDSNGDGQLTPAELIAGQQAQRQKRQARGMGQGQAHGMGGSMAAFSDFDLNGDGKIAVEEFDEVQNKRSVERTEQGHMMKNLSNAPSFDELDSDEDGLISQAEFSAHLATGGRQQAR